MRRTHIRTSISAALLLPLCTLCAPGVRAGEPEGLNAGVRVATAGGSELWGLLELPAAPMLLTSGGPQALAWDQVVRIRIAPRAGAEAENEARQALGGLRSDDFQTRDKALVKLKDLGRAALRPLREAAAGSDPDIAAHARRLLTDLGATDDPTLGLDCAELRDGSTLAGELRPRLLPLRTAHGRFILPLTLLRTLEPLTAEQRAAIAPAPDGQAPLPARSEWLEGRPAAWAFVSPPRFVEWSVFNLERLKQWLDTSGLPELPPAALGGVIDDEKMKELLEEFEGPVPDGRRAPKLVQESLPVRPNVWLDFASRPLPKQKDGPATAPVAVGEALSEAYLAEGVRFTVPTGHAAPVCALLKAPDEEGVKADAPVELGLLGVPDAKPIPGLLAKDGVLNIRFQVDAAGTPGGAQNIELALGLAFDASVVVSAYGADGALVARKERDAGDVPPEYHAAAKKKDPGPAVRVVRIHSNAPIAALNIQVRGGSVLWLVRMGIDRLRVAQGDPRYSRVEMLDGGALAGELLAASLETGLSLRADFLPENAAALTVPWAAVRTFTPARQMPAGTEKDDDPEAAKRKALLERAMGRVHAVLLQNGAQFRALFVRLGETDCELLLHGGVKLTLPRALLRKIDLRPEGSDPIAVAEGEKPGVEFRRRKAAKAEGEEPKDAPPEKGASVLESKQVLKRMDDVKIVAVDLTTGELTTDDGGGDWTISLQPVKELVFPPQAAEVERKAAPGWTLTLADGSRFDVDPVAIGTDALTVSLAGGKVKFPLSLVDILRRAAP